MTNYRPTPIAGQTNQPVGPHTFRRVSRTYLLDAQGKILWLDMEYSRATRYDLRNALHFYLQK